MTLPDQTKTSLEKWIWVPSKNMFQIYSTTHVYVVVNFLSQVICVFLLF